jgi:hypothetical protein
MISTYRKFIYVHVPKTGGNSIQTVLEPFSDDRKSINTHQDGVDRFNITGPVTQNKHDSLAAYKAAPGDITSYFSFFSARHPYHRALSGYFSAATWARQNDAGVWEVLSPVWDRSEFLKFATRLRPIVDYIKINNAIYPVSDIIRLESIRSDFERIKRALDIPRAPPLGHFNRTMDQGGLVGTLLDDKPLRQIIEDRFSEDMNYLGY